MRWPWRKEPRPEIPPYPPAPIEPKITHKPKDDSIVVEEVDTSAMTRTGVHKAWHRLRGSKP